MAREPGQVSEVREPPSAAPSGGHRGRSWQGLSAPTEVVQYSLQGHEQIGVGRRACVDAVALGASCEHVVGEVVRPAQRPAKQGAHDVLGDALGEVLVVPPGVGARPCLPPRTPQRVLPKVVGQAGTVGPQHAHGTALAIDRADRQSQRRQLGVVGIQVLARQVRQWELTALCPPQEVAYAGEIGADAGDRDRLFAGRGVLDQQSVEQKLGGVPVSVRDLREVEPVGLAVCAQPCRRQRPHVIAVPGGLFQLGLGPQRTPGQDQSVLGHGGAMSGRFGSVCHDHSFGPCRRSSIRWCCVSWAAARWVGLKRGRMSRVRICQVAPYRAVHCSTSRR
ncbi:hypothetical protein EV562_12033 [Streptomyces sp. BK208]|nr:hypothetical protein EV562_12033 [Streptomyces sp. BK208]